ncbi:MAG TPA: molybdopterin-dependent oxidoreductase [Terriglobales bacterium]
MADVNIIVDGKKIAAPAGSLLIEACKSHGIEIPAFCYYPGLSLQGACRMCLVRVEKMPKLQTACTTVISEGMTVTTTSDEVRQARKSMLEMVLANHPLDCPVCDAGGECELQDMTFTYGAGESKFIDIKNHRDEQQWSPVVFFDRPRCILCYRCVRVCGEGMDVWALGVQNRGVGSVIAPNKEDHLECEECGACIDICPVGALTSGAYRYKTRPWEMNHIGTVCTHCGDGCKTTLGVRSHADGMEIVRGDNRDKSGINGDFLCIKGRYAFDFSQEPRRLKEPLIHRDGKLQPATWDEALELIGRSFREIVSSAGGQAMGVIGSNRTTNEENYLLQKFARTVLGTNNIDHHRTADYPAFAAAMSGGDRTASMTEVLKAPAMLLIGNNPTDEHPLLAWQIRTNVRLNRGRLYVVNAYPIKLRRQATTFLQVSEDGGEGAFVSFLAGQDVGDSLASKDASKESLDKLRDTLRGEQGLVVAFGAELRAEQISTLVNALPNAKFICLGDYANSRGAADMGLYPDLLPGYIPLTDAGRFREEWFAQLPAQPGLDLQQMFAAANDGRIQGMLIVGSNPVSRYAIDPFTLSKMFVVVQDMFLTETAIPAQVVLPVASAYEKSGTFTNTCGDLQMLKKAGHLEGVKSDFEIIVRIAAAMGADVRKLVPFGRALKSDMGQSRGAQAGEADRHAVWLENQGLEPKMSPYDPIAMLDEIQRLVPGYDVSRLNLATGTEVHTTLSAVGQIPSHPELVLPSKDTLFTSGTLGRYSKTLNSVMENERRAPVDKEVPV